MPTSVMPIWTDDRKRAGFSASFMATRAPLLPRSAIAARRARREETMASSDMANQPLRSTRKTMTAISKASDMAVGRLRFNAPW